MVEESIGERERKKFVEGLNNYIDSIRVLVRRNSLRSICKV